MLVVVGVIAEYAVGPELVAEGVGVTVSPNMDPYGVAVVRGEGEGVGRGAEGSLLLLKSAGAAVKPDPPEASVSTCSSLKCRSPAKYTADVSALLLT